MPNSPINITVNVDATHALSTVTKCIRSVAAKLFDFLFIEHKSITKSKASHIEAQAKIDNDLLNTPSANAEGFVLRLKSHYG